MSGSRKWTAVRTLPPLGMAVIVMVAVARVWRLAAGV